ncbi:protein FAR1-RELATED SEQUENCE 8-like [Punica granatum]|uniref:Protein FAR1-RELATED SEQUENCE 8-like n=2 Tax=Punica granatum TaxID=22663 RepID=A0A6P8CLY2_PUNGR|nr:protein FAR1-RELATED SEQUENCE 8-like [Punica granatum]PKI32008.1 hypothetical protein CRG98_047617 [Punica granatum]
MTGGGAFSPSGEALSLNTNLNITTGDSQTSDQLLEDEGDGLEIDSNDIENDGDELLGMNDDEQVLELNDSDQVLEIIGNDPEDERVRTVNEDHQDGGSDWKEYPPPVPGMEFDSYDDAYNYYNCYAKELGFAIRVKSSWTKRNSKEKRGAVLCCNCEGFKTVKEASTRRKETRTGCLAMIRLRLVESNRWRVDEVKLEHNHLFDPVRAKNSKSHKKMDGAKHKVEPDLDIEVQTIKLYRAPVADIFGNGSSTPEEREIPLSRGRHLKLNKGDAQVIQDFFCRSQLADPNFLYLMDLNDEGNLRNVFWLDAKSRAAYNYFGDVVAFDTTCLSNNYKIPLFAFVGVNHHGQSVLLGCGLIAEETIENYIWLFRAWLSCMSGRPPQTIVSDQCKTMQNASAEVFPRANHRFFLSRLMQSIVGNVGPLHNPSAFFTALEKIVYDSPRGEDFEMAWEEMIQRLGLGGHEWLQALYDSRERWAPVYIKDIFLAGISGFQRGDNVSSFFEGYVHGGTSLQEFFNMYELVVEKSRQKEALDDSESKHMNPSLRTRCYYELQLSRLYTKSIFNKFQEEVVSMSSCVSITQVHEHGLITTYHVKEREGEGDLADLRNFEVTYDKTGAEVRCICGCFNFNGYLCRHALCVLNYNGAEEIPFHYILSRWRKDFNRLYVPEFGSNNVDISNPVQWFDHLYRRAMLVVEEGIASEDHYAVAWQAFQESLNKVRLEGEKHV